METSKIKVMEVAMELGLPKPVLDKIAQKFGPAEAQECAMSTSVGGIGPLLRERIYAQAELGVQVVTVSLLYDSVWIQSWHEWGQINLAKKKTTDALRKTLEPTTLDFELSLFDGQNIQVKVWKQNFDHAAAYFLDVPDISNLVYPGPVDAPGNASDAEGWAHRQRLKQSWLVGRGALALCKKLAWTPDIVVLSETPTFFCHHRLVKDRFQNDPFFSQTKYIFNDHTPMEYAHPHWDLDTLRTVHVDPALYEPSPAWNPKKMELDVTSFLVGSSEGVFGVSKCHAAVMKNMKSLHDFIPKIESVTNGVRIVDWQAPGFEKYKSLSDTELMEKKKQIKKKFLDWGWRRFKKSPAWQEMAMNKPIVVWTRRVTSYKRLDVFVKCLKDPDLLKRFMASGVIMLVGGRIHQQDHRAQEMIFQFLDLINSTPGLSDQVIFMKNFNLWEAPLIYQGCDGTVMLSDDTKEASATGFMKAQLNGGVVVATSDGAVPEFVQFNGSEQNGFQVPYVDGEPTPEGFVAALEQLSQVYQNSEKWSAMMRSSLDVVQGVDVARTARETMKIYEKVLET